MQQPEMISMRIKEFKPKMLFIIEDDKLAVNDVKNRFANEKKRLVAIRPIDYFIYKRSVAY